MSACRLRKLKAGDTLGFVAPSTALSDPVDAQRAAQAARALGFRVKLSPSCTARYGYLSGPDDMRARDINTMFADPDVHAVVCLAGGYGTPRILDKIDYDCVRQNPKPFLGYSDITGLHLAFSAMTGMPTLHGPMPVRGWLDGALSGFSGDSLMACLRDDLGARAVRNPEGDKVACVNGGAAEGVLIGGNLSLCCALAGTPYFPDPSGKLILLEDVGEKLYRVDRMLTQLRLAGVFEKCAGVVLGAFTDCPVEYEDRTLTLSDIVRDVVAPCGKPVTANWQIGHCTPKITVALGVKYRMDADAGTLTRLAPIFED